MCFIRGEHRAPHSALSETEIGEAFRDALKIHRDHPALQLSDEDQQRKENGGRMMVELCADKSTFVWEYEAIKRRPLSYLHNALSKEKKNEPMAIRIFYNENRTCEADMFEF